METVIRSILVSATKNCSGCGKSGHKVKECPNVKGKHKGSGQAKANGCNVDVPMKNHFSTLR